MPIDFPLIARGQDVGSANAYKMVMELDPSSYPDLCRFVFTAASANSGACTFELNDLGPIPIKDPFYGIADLKPNTILVNQIVDITFDGTNFQMISIHKVVEFPSHTAFGDAVIDEYPVGQGPFSIVQSVAEVTEDVDTANHFGQGVQVTRDPQSQMPEHAMTAATMARGEIASGNAQEMSGTTLIGSSADAIYGGTHETPTNFIAVGSASGMRNDNSGHVTIGFGHISNVDNNSSGRLEQCGGHYSVVENHSDGSMGVAVGMGAGVKNTGSGDIETACTILASEPENTGGGTMEFVFGCNIKDHSGFGSVKSDNIYSQGANSTNMFEGTLETLAGLILKAPGGARYQVGVSDLGVLTLTPL